MVESECGAVAVGRTYLLPPLSSGGALLVRPWLRFHTPLIESDMQICRIRLSDKTSRLHPRRAPTKPCEAYELEVPVKVREWIAPALASPDVVLVSEPPAQPHSRVVVERAIGFAGGADTEVIGPSAQRAVQHVDKLCGLLPATRSVGQRVDTRRMLIGTWAAAGPSASIAATTSSWSRLSKRPLCSALTGPFRTARSRPRSCWPIRRCDGIDPPHRRHGTSGGLMTYATPPGRGAERGNWPGPRFLRWPRPGQASGPGPLILGRAKR